MDLEHGLLIAIGVSTAITMAVSFAILGKAVRDVASMTREILREIRAK